MSDGDDGQMVMVPMHMVQQHQQTPRKPTLNPMPLAQAMDLLAAYRKSEEEHPIIAGELYVEKPGLGIFTDDDPERRVVIIVWRALRTDDEIDYHVARKVAQRTNGKVPDIIIARKHDGDLLMMPYESWRLEPYTGPRE